MHTYDSSKIRITSGQHGLENRIPQVCIILIYRHIDKRSASSPFIGDPGRGSALKEKAKSQNVVN
jgi:hypothetical protein